jgi:hypothetical protein
MNRIWLTQIAAIIRLELKKTFFARRGLWIYLLALMPVLLFVGHEQSGSRSAAGHATLFVFMG